MIIYDFFVISASILRMGLFLAQWGHFLPQGYDLNNFNSGPFDEATYQISRIWAIQFLTKRFLKVFPI